MSPSKSVVFLPLTRTNWPIFLRIAKDISRRGAGRPLIILSNPVVKSLARSSRDGVEFIDLCKPDEDTVRAHASSDRKPISGASGRKSTAGRDWLKKLPFFNPVSAWAKALVLRRQVHIAERLLRQYDITSVVVAGDRNTGFEPPLLKAARMRGIPSVIPPTAFSATVEGLFIARRQNPFHFVTHNAKFKCRFPNQWRHDPLSGEDISFFSVPTTLAYAGQGMLPENPWVLGGGWSTRILVDSMDIKDRYEKMGVSPDKIIVTGHPDYDDLYGGLLEKNATRDRLARKYGLDADKPIVVVCLPNWAEMEMKSWDWHWQESGFLCECAVAQGCNVLLSLHPSQERSRYLHLEEKFTPLRILDERLSAVLPAADIYLTGLSSSTISWAALCAVPVVVADHYPEKDHIYEGLPGVTYVTDANLLHATLSALVAEASSSARDFSRQKNDARYGILDGQAVQRIIDCVLSPDATPA
jgi:hypothetical protein